MTDRQKRKRKADISGLLSGLAHASADHVVLRPRLGGPGDVKTARALVNRLGLTVEDRGGTGIYHNWQVNCAWRRWRQLGSKQLEQINVYFEVSFVGGCPHIDSAQVTSLEQNPQIVQAIAHRRSAHRSFRADLKDLKTHLSFMVDALLNAQVQLPIDVAKELLNDVNRALVLVKMVNVELDHNEEGARGSLKCAEDVCRHAYELGLLAERCAIRLAHEVAASTGHRKAERNARIAKKCKVSEEEHIRRHQAVMAVLQRRRISRGEAYEIAAQEYRHKGRQRGLGARAMQNSFLLIDRRIVR